MIKVFGHPGSKSGYIKKLINDKFIGTLKSNNETYEFGNKINIDSNTLYVYVDRKFRYMIQSLYKIRNKFGISNDISFAKFHDCQYCNNCNNDCECNLFEYIDMSPRTYWEKYSSSWIELSNKYNNVIVVFFDNIIKNKQILFDKIVT